MAQGGLPRDPDVNAEEKFDRMMATDGESIEMEVTRATIEEGRSFSEEAMRELTHSMESWVVTRLLRRWDATGEPPTVVKVAMRVDVS